MAEVFVSYARKDAPVADAINKRLRNEGYEVFDDHAIASGEDLSDVVGKRLASSNAVIVLLSANTKRSNWVEPELREALGQQRVLVPVLLDNQATQNRVWPLIADRKAITVDSPEDIAGVVQQLDRAMHKLIGSPKRIADDPRGTHETDP